MSEDMNKENEKNEMEVEKKADTYIETEEINKVGNVSIADDVVASIAGIAATEVPGVSKLTGNLSKEIIAKIGKKNLTTGVKLDIVDGIVTLYLSIEIEYGNNIKKVSEEVQAKVKQAIENMTGLTVREVNISISGIKLDKN